MTDKPPHRRLYPDVDPHMSDEELTYAAEVVHRSVNWENLPKLADIFQHRPRQNRYWHELVAIVLSGLEHHANNALTRRPSLDDVLQESGPGSAGPIPVESPDALADAAGAVPSVLEPSGETKRDEEPQPRGRLVLLTDPGPAVGIPVRLRPTGTEAGNSEGPEAAEVHALSDPFYHLCNLLDSFPEVESPKPLKLKFPALTVNEFELLFDLIADAATRGDPSAGLYGAALGFISHVVHNKLSTEQLHTVLDQTIRAVNDYVSGNMNKPVHLRPVEDP